MTPPDSGEHSSEPQCGDANCRIPVHSRPDSGDREVRLRGYLYEVPGSASDWALIPRDLAQRILAALEQMGDLYPVGIIDWRLLAAELRAVMERKP